MDVDVGVDMDMDMDIDDYRIGEGRSFCISNGALQMNSWKR